MKAQRKWSDTWSQFDEATPALDTESKKFVQETLNSAHRHKDSHSHITQSFIIKNADKICVMHE